MNKSRREFLKKGGIGLAGLSLYACQRLVESEPTSTPVPLHTHTSPATATKTTAPTQTPKPTPTFSPTQLSDLVTPNEIEFLTAHEIKEGDTSRPVVMMTYDDTGSYKDVRTILDAFKSHNMKASFFYIGEKMYGSSKAVRAIVEEGHLLGCHGYAHNDFLRLSDDQINRRLEKSFQTVDEIVPGYRMRFIRFPYGSGVGSERILRVAAMWGLQHIYWSTGSHGNTRETHDIVVRNAQNGAIVLSHMYRQFDVEQAPEIVSSLVEAGFSLETVETGRAPSDIFSGI